MTEYKSSLKSKRVLCILAWFTTLLIPALAFIGITLPWYNRIDRLDARTETVLDQIQRFERLLTTIPRLKADLERELNNEEVKAFYFNAPTAALAGAQLQGTIQEIVQTAGARLINSQFLPAEPNEKPPKINIRAQIQGDTNALLDIMYNIEQARPFLFIDQLSIRSTTRRERRDRRQPGSAPATQTQQELTIRLDIFGYALGNVS